MVEPAPMTNHDSSHDKHDNLPLDDAVAYGLAAKALRCSRRTIERYVERGELVRADDATVASVSRSSLVALLELRGADERQLRDTAHVAATGVAALPPAVEQLLEQQVGEASERDELIVQLISGSWSERRAARRAARSRLSVK